MNETLGIDYRFAFAGGDTKQFSVRLDAAFAERLRAAAQNDASVNALVNLHCLGEMVPPAAEEMLEQLRGHFAALLQAGG